MAMILFSKNISWRITSSQLGLLGVGLLVANLMAAPSWAKQTCWTEGPSQFADTTHYCVSSMLPPQGRFSYGPKNLVGYFGSVGAWCEGVRGHGIGETITIRIDRAPAFRRLLVRNGYGRSAKSFTDNGRLKTVRITSDTGIDTMLDLVDQPNEQPLYLPIIAPHRWVKIEIVDVYTGARYADTCVSAIGPDFVYEEELLAGPAPQAPVSPQPVRPQRPPKQTVKRPPTSTVTEQVDRLFWDTVKNSNDLRLFESYLQRFPQGAFVHEAKRRIRTLKGSVLGREKKSAPVSPDDDTQVAAVPKNSAAKLADVDTELRLWNRVKLSNVPADLEAYLGQYPNGVFAGIAKRRLMQIQLQAKVSAGKSRP